MWKRMVNHLLNLLVFITNSNNSGQSYFIYILSIFLQFHIVQISRYHMILSTDISKYIYKRKLQHHNYTTMLSTFSLILSNIHCVLNFLNNLIFRLVVQISIKIKSILQLIIISLQNSVIYNFLLSLVLFTIYLFKKIGSIIQEEFPQYRSY